jgi:UMF1 family MFS transporter
MKTSTFSTDQSKRKAWFGWCLYDWANSAFATVILSAVLPVFFASLVPDGRATLTFAGINRTLPATALWGYAVSFSMLIVVLLAPYLGAWADAHRARKKLFIRFCLFGALSTSLLILVGPGDYQLTLFLFVLANICFACGNIFYNSFLPALATKHEVDILSSRGFAYGYVGGGVMLLVAFLLIRYHNWFGLADAAEASRISFLVTGLWWFLFALPAFKYVREDVFTGTVDPFIGGIKGYLATFSEIRECPDLLRFLFAYIFYNDGIQTIIAVAAIFASSELKLPQGTILGCFLMIQFLAMPGAILFGKMAQRFGAKPTIQVALSVFVVITLYAGRMTSAADFWILGVLVALVLGGSQAISRSLFASMIPTKKSAEFFGFYAVSGRFASIVGPLLFALIIDITGSARLSISALTLFFIIGMILLRTVNVVRGQKLAET